MFGSAEGYMVVFATAVTIMTAKAYMPTWAAVLLGLVMAGFIVYGLARNE